MGRIVGGKGGMELFHFAQVPQGMDFLCKVINSVFASLVIWRSRTLIKPKGRVGGGRMGDGEKGQDRGACA